MLFRNLSSRNAAAVVREGPGASPATSCSGLKIIGEYCTRSTDRSTPVVTSAHAVIVRIAKKPSETKSPIRAVPILDFAWTMRLVASGLFAPIFIDALALATIHTTASGPAKPHQATISNKTISSALSAPSIHMERSADGEPAA